MTRIQDLYKRPTNGANNKKVAASRLRFIGCQLALFLTVYTIWLGFAQWTIFAPVHDVIDATSPSLPSLSGSRNLGNPQQQVSLLAPVHVLMGLSGSHVGFMSEVEIAVKSVLLNAPLDRDLQVHFMADGLARKAALEFLDRIAISTWKTRNQITFIVHNVEGSIDAWESRINMVFEQERKSNMNTYRHTVGAYFRLFAHEILGPDVQHVLYMDSDAIILANLDELWRVRTSEQRNIMCISLLLSASILPSHSFA